MRDNSDRRRHALDFDERPYFPSIAPVREKIAIELPPRSGLQKSKEMAFLAVGECSSIPGTAAQYLRDYQIIGVQWLWKQYCDGIGGILGYASFCVSSSNCYTH
jgi:SNF2 family DNA or RNA helicase